MNAAPTDLLTWLSAAPAGTLASEIAALLTTTARTAPTTADSAAATSWRERIWSAHTDTRMGVREVAEALGRSRDYVYQRTAPSGTAARIPHRKLDGDLVFVAGEIRDWIRSTEILVAAPVPVLRKSSAPRLTLAKRRTTATH